MPAILILLLPLAEIATFIFVGREIGILPTLALVIASSVIGAIILRDAGTLALSRLQQQRENPEAILREGGVKIAAGLLLLVPGFLTDLLALALLIPRMRSPIASRTVSFAEVARRRRQRKPEPHIVEGEFRRLDRN